MHGYELMQRLYAVLGFTIQPSYGALYPMLRKMETRGLIVHVNQQGGYGPRKRIYSLTDKGVLRLRELLLSERYAIGLPLQIIFLDHLAAGERRKVLLQICQQKTKELERLIKRAKQIEHLSKYQQSAIDFGIRSFREQIEWAESLAHLTNDERLFG